MNGYIGFYKGKRFECVSDTNYHAQQKMAVENKVKKSHEITVMLAEKDEKQVVHTADF